MNYDADLTEQGSMIIESDSFIALQKIFHSFAFDIREFAIDYLEIGFEDFLNSLSFLTYLHLLMYEIDFDLENNEIDFYKINSIYDKIKIFLKQNEFYDEKTLNCIDKAKKYHLITEKIRNDCKLKINEAHSALGLKVSDLELLKRVLIKVNNKKISDKKFLLFHRIDKIREVFDDIRDYEEDLKTVSFNIYNYYCKIYGSKLGKEKLKIYTEMEIEKLKTIIHKERDEKLEKIINRLEDEKRYYFNKLNGLTE